MIKKILVFSFSLIGDAALSTAVISPLRQHFPDAKITFLVGVGAFDLLDADPQIDRVLVYDNRGEHAGWRGKIRLIKLLRREGFDLVVDLRDSVWSRFVGGKHWSMRLRRGNIHAVTRYLDVLQRRGVDVNGARPQLQFTPSSLSKRDAFLTKNGVNRRQVLVGIHPGGNWVYKLWRPESFAQIADRLCEKWNVQILLFAAPNERQLQAQVADLMCQQPISVKEDDLCQVAALILLQPAISISAMIRDQCTSQLPLEPLSSVSSDRQTTIAVAPMVRNTSSSTATWNSVATRAIPASVPAVVERVVVRS